MRMPDSITGSESASVAKKMQQDLEGYEAKLKYHQQYEQLQSHQQFQHQYQREAIKLRIFDVPRFSPKTSAENLEKPTLNQVSTSRIGSQIGNTRQMPSKVSPNPQNSP